MGWTLPAALAGLVLAAAPVLVHLIRRRDLPRIPLPTLALLERAQVRSRRRLHLVDLLLLLCRVLLIAALAVGVAGPYVMAEVAWGQGRTASVALVIDDSMSMGTRTGSETPLSAAVDRAVEIVDSLPTGSEVTVVAAGHPVRTVAPLTTDLDTARDRLDNLDTRTARGTDLQGAVARATRELEGAKRAERALVVLSDFVRHAEAASVPWPDNVPTTLEKIGGDAPVPNRTVSQAVAAPDPTQPGHASVRVTVRVFDAGDDEVEVVLHHQGTEITRRRLSPSEGVGRATLTAPLPDNGDPTARVALAEGDGVPADDARGVLLRSPNAVRVLVVDGDPHPSRLQDEVAFLTQAFDVAPRDQGTIAYRTVDRDTLDARSLTRVDLLVLANVPAPSPSTTQAIRTFVERGGGLLIAPGARAEARTYGGRFEGLLPARPSATAPGPEAPGLVSTDTSELVPSGGAGLAGVETSRRWILEPGGADSEVLLRFPDGSPALAVARFGEGRVAVLATTLDDDWTNLPYRPGFVPLMLGLTQGLAPSARLPERPFAPGVTVPIPVAPSVRHLRVITPGGDAHDFRGPNLAEEVEFRKTQRPGAYRVQVATATDDLHDDPRAAFVVAPPLDESVLSPAPLPTVASRDRARATAGSSNLVRRSLAPWLFLAAGLLALLEAWLRRPRALALLARGKRPV